MVESIGSDIVQYVWKLDIETTKGEKDDILRLLRQMFYMCQSCEIIRNVAS